jgi:hypothetical protein
VQRLGYFTVFVLPALALFAFTQGGWWAWAFVPIMGSLAAAEVISYLWKGKARRHAPALTEASESK